LSSFWNSATASAASKQIINLGSSKEYTIMEAATILKSVVGDLQIKFTEGRHEVHMAYSTHEKSEKILGFKESTDLPEGLAAMWEWAKKQPQRTQFVWPKYELEKGIYQFWK
jgi:UDP-glucose 4-epimerase